VPLQVRAEGLAEQLDAVVGQFEIGKRGVGNAANIVLAKDSWFQHEIIWNHASVGYRS
jgi:hypothetical protein